MVFGFRKTATAVVGPEIDNVNFNVLKQNYCTLIGAIKDWISQNARYNCEKKRISSVVCDFFRGGGEHNITFDIKIEA
jgi:hypothetical protein